MNSAIVTGVSALAPKGRKLILAVSGGIDSMTLATAAYMGGIPFEVAHCNFHLRGEDSNLDESLVRSWCSERNIVCHVKSFDTQAFASSQGVSIEMAARELRYAWFATLGDCVMVAHNANDNAETLLLNLTRGTGIRGLCGMAPSTKMKLSAKIDGLMVLRPFLGISRREIEEFALENKIPYREDVTNADVAYKRNRIRHQVIPALEALNPSFLKTVSDETARFRDVSSIADEYFNSALGGCLPGPEGARVKLSLLASLGHRDYVLFRLMEPYGYNSADVAAVSDLMTSGRQAPGKVFRCGAFVAYFTSDEFVIEPFASSFEPVTVTGEGEWRCGDSNVLVIVEDVPSDLKSPGCIYADAALLPFPFVLRPWREGDWMKPLGMRGKKRKLSDIFVSLKVPSAKKGAVILLSYPGVDGRVGAIVGWDKIDDGLSVRPGVTGKVVKISIDGGGSED